MSLLRRRLLPALLPVVLLALVLGVAPAADAANRTTRDTRGDAVTGIDITRWTIRYGDRRVSASMKVRGLTKRAYQRFYFVLGDPQNGPDAEPEYYIVLSVGRRGRTSVKAFYYREDYADITCRGLRGSVNARKDLVRISSSTDCDVFDLRTDISARRSPFEVGSARYTAEQYAEGFAYGSPSHYDRTKRVSVRRG